MDVTDIMIDDLKRLGINEGDTIFMHASLKSLGEKIEPLDVIKALRDCVGESGTIVLPALSYMYCNKENPIFDYNKTPSNIGVIPEVFRTQCKDVLRSLAPTHSCCSAGRMADFVTNGHILDNTPCGPNSPFRRVMELGGKILFLGCGMRPNTSMHAVEELYEPDYLYGETVEYKIVKKDGTEIMHPCRSHYFKNVEQRYDRLENLLDKGSEIRTGNVLKAFCHLVEAKPMWEKAGEKYSENPHYFVDFH